MPGTGKTITVGTLAELRQVVHDWRPGAESDASFRLEFAPAGAARLEWERNLAAWYGDCGCFGGVLGAIAATVGYIVAGYWARWFPAPEDASGLLWCAGVFVFGSAAGKLVGLAHARLRLSATVHRIERAYR